MTKNIKKKSWMSWLVFLADLEIIAISISFFYDPINIAAGSSTDISVLVDVVRDIDQSITVLIVNILMLILAVIFLGKKTTRNVILGNLLFLILMEITPSFKVTSNQLLAVIYGGALMGLGVFLLYRVSTSSDGTAIPPIILKEYFYINPATELLAIDTVIIFLNIFVDDWSAFLLTTSSQAVTAMTMNYAEAGFDRKYQACMMSNEHFEGLKAMLLDSYNGSTIYGVAEGYSDDDREQLLLVVDTYEYGPLINKIHEVDSDAFIITDTIAYVHGGQWGL